MGGDDCVVGLWALGTFRDVASQLARAADASLAPPPAAAQSPTLAELYDQHADFVYRSLVSLKLDPHAAEDAMQEVFLVAQRRLPEFHGPFFKAWLYRIATGVASNARRSWWRRSRQTADVDLEALADPSSAPFEQVAHSERVELLQTLLQRLSDKEREVFVLVALEQLPQEQVARALDVHVNTVAGRLRAAKENLERLIRSHRRTARGGRDG